MRALATQLSLPVAHLEGKRIEPVVLDLISVELAEKYMCLPLFVKQEAGRDTLYLGMEDPCDLEALDDIGFRTGMRISAVMVGPSDLCEAVDRFYHRRSARLELTGAEQAASAPLGEITLSDALEDRESEPFRELSLEAATPPDPEQAPVEPPVQPAIGQAAAMSEPGHEAAAAAPTPVAQLPAAASDQRTRMILRAVTQLLIDKGVLTREDLAARVKQLEDASGGD